MMEKLISLDRRIIIRSFLVFICFYYSSLLQYIPIIFFNMNIESIRGNMSMAVLLSCFSSVVFSLILLIIYRDDLVKEFKTFKKNWVKNFDTGFKWYLVGLVVMMTSNLVLYYVLHSGGASNENTVQAMISASPIFMAVQVCLIAPFNEEVVFRKTLYDVFKNKWIFIFLSFLLFGGAHVMSSASSLVDYLYIIPYGALGAAFAMAYSKTKTIFTSMSLHILHNTCLFLLSVLI